MSAEVLLGLGTNLGEREENIRRAIRELRQEVKITRLSSLYETEPVGERDQPFFFNLCLRGRTSLSPEAFFQFLKESEVSLGRTPTYRWGPRVIDLDLLFYGDRVIKEKELTVPHPEIAERLFVLLPLLEIVPHFSHPVLERDILDLFLGCAGKEKIFWRGRANWSSDPAPIFRLRGKNQTEEVALKLGGFPHGTLVTSLLPVPGARAKKFSFSALSAEKKGKNWLESLTRALSSALWKMGVRADVRGSELYREKERIGEISFKEVDAGEIFSGSLLWNFPNPVKNVRLRLEKALRRELFSP